MPQNNLIKSEEIEITAPTTVVKLSSDQENAGGGYFHPQNPENPLPQHHTIQLTNLDELFARKVTLQTIETALEQAEPFITANQLGLVVLLTQDAQIIGDIQTGKLTFKNLQDDLLEALAQSLDQPTYFVTTRGADELAEALDLQLMDYVKKAGMTEQELLGGPLYAVV